MAAANWISMDTAIATVLLENVGIFTLKEVREWHLRFFLMDKLRQEFSQIMWCITASNGQRHLADIIPHTNRKP